MKSKSPSVECKSPPVFGERPSVFFFALAALFLGCGSKTPDTVTLRASGGLDGAPFAGDPSVARVELHVRAQDGTEKSVASADASAGALDVPDSVRSTGGVGALALVGLGSDGALLAYGRTPDVDLAGLDQTSVAVSILVQRVGSMRRAYELPSATTGRPTIVPYGARFVLVADASSGALVHVDLLAGTTKAEAISLPAPPATLATAGNSLLSLDASGNASLLHPGDTQPSTPTAPSGTSFADVAGGAFVVGEDEAAYLVGATRSSASEASDVVLRMATDGTFGARHWRKARSGASIAWIFGLGLVIMGGEAVGGPLPPELLSSGATDSQPLSQFPADATKGALLAYAGASKAARLLADGSIELFDLGCTSSICTPTKASVTVSGSARADDAFVALERGGFLVVRGGAASIVDASLSKVTALGDVGASIGVARLQNGSIAIVAATDAVVRVIR